jgi:cytochrome d ubiquinol oxidase subunit II
MQGTTVGALAEGLPVSNGRYVGGAFGWFSPFAVLCGIGLCIGYSLLGACWLVKKSEGEVREAAYYRMHYLTIGLLAFLVIVFVYALVADLRVMARWVERPYLFVFPAIGAAATIALGRNVLRREDGAPFYMVALIFAAAFGTLAISFWPYMIPFSITIEEAAAPHSSPRFHVLGSRPVRLPADAPLHRHQLPRLSRQGQTDRGELLDLEATDRPCRPAATAAATDWSRPRFSQR